VFDSLFNVLVETLLGENSVSTWGLLASVVIAAEHVKGITQKIRLEKSRWLVEEGSQFLYHFQVQELSHGSMRTFEARTRAWVMEGPLAAQNLSDRRVENDSITSFAMTAYLSGQLPTNFYLRKSLIDYRGVQISGFGDGVINLAFMLLQSKAIFDEKLRCFNGEPYDVLNMVTVLASWPYLLFYGRKLDLAQFFPDSHQSDASIRDFLLRIQSNTCNGKKSLDFHVEQALMAFKIIGFFQLSELRRLIDESYVGCE
jgi:hypothetical protein